ncbi:secreted RxLR effector peptide protein, putative [Phytophthora infestans T30-4]|uniref:Secreted RxLR effector peptide protein, putative n=1 Tax=Phytophthora infestans (strain T30-4) TaxID=403677 RepID=D0N3M3_PHYIT|nr:secreted RxLR effector peptide protein, putative [Phytophthora infestans T30-4]EEY68977.1 secreted RxLR effector peptide protein, putative [Phytophthora infestans T30-4]|eukprot:XP_002998831.1 secreted RxLR effector peptide protein, putative [Phytophthora infestans T30-4]
MVVAIQRTAVILLVITALSAVVGADATKVNGPAARFVRFDTIAGIDQNNDERGLNFGANPIIAKIKTRINKILSQPKLHDWLKHSVSGGKVFEMLGLQLVQRNLLTNPNFLLWVKYVNDLNTKKPNPERVSAASLLIDRFGSAKLSEMLKKKAAVKDQNTKALALELQAQRLQDWKQLKKTPLDVFELIHLSKSDTLLDPVFPVWLKYVDDFHSQNYKINSNFIEILSRGLGEKGMAQTLEQLKDPLQAGSAFSVLTSH